jgi:hypothetical protein
MTESEARQKIQISLNTLRMSHAAVSETPVETDDATVDYHIASILKSSNGAWNQAAARRYIQKLEAEIQDEIADSTINVLNKRKGDVTY